MDLERLRRTEYNQQYIAAMRPVFNRRALFTDTSAEYVIPEEPEPYSEVTIRFRTARNNVDRIFLVSGGQKHLMVRVESNNDFDYYAYVMRLDDQKVSYYFEVQTGRITGIFDMRGLVQEVNEYYDFIIIPGFHTPDWAKGAVMYQIYTDRFCNGDPSNDVLTNEYCYIGEPVHRVEDWGRYPAQMDVREFYGGDLQGVLDKMDYLQELGVELLWSTPFFPSPQRDNGYDVSDYCAVDPRFGTMEELEELIAEADKRNIGLMFDMVFNHTSTEHEWFQKALAGDEKYQNYYIFKDGTPDKIPTNWVSKFGGPAWEYVPSLGKWYLHLFDVTQADLNWENPEVREELKNVLRFWKTKGIKGFRFDVVNLISKPEIFENDYIGDGRRFYTDGRHVHEFLKEMVRDAGIADMTTVGEMSSTSLDNCVRYTAPKEQELSMVFTFHHLKVDYKDGDKWSLMAADLMKLKDLFCTWQEGMQAEDGWNAVFWCNHDQPRAVSRFGNEDKYWKESAKMLAAAIHLMRGTPYIYQGEEIGMTNPHYTSIDQYRDVESLNYYRILMENGKTSEEALQVLAERSRDNGRTPMQWDDSHAAGFTTGTPWIYPPENYRQINVAAQMNDETSVRAFYKKLVQLRKEMEIISEGKIEFLMKEDENVLAYRRYTDSQEMLVMCNLASEEAPVTLPQGWENTDVLIANWDNATAPTDLTLRPYECLALIK